MTVPVLQTRRCVLRAWREEDLESLARLNADPRVMEHFPAPLSRTESDALAVRIRAHFEAHGFGLWAIEVPGVAPFIGFVGLMNVTFEAHFTPCVEMAWRLDVPFWNKGYAREAARAAMTFAFETLRLPELVAFTTPANMPSIAVMEAIGMKRDLAGDFDHPRLVRGTFPSRCVLYRSARRADLIDSSPLARSRAFAASLDADEFERVRTLLTPDCRYEVRGSVLVGADAILASYADSTRRAHAKFDAVRYESAVEACGTIAFCDVLTVAGRDHRFRSLQHLTFDGEGRIMKIVHEDLPGEQAALEAFMTR